MLCRSFTVAVLAAVGAVACSQGGSGGDGMVRATSAEALQGSWQSTCMDADKFGLTESSRLEIHGTTATQVTAESATGSCGSTAILISQTATVSAGNPVGQGRALDFTLTNVRVKPMSATGTSILNLAKFCGIGDWKTGVERDVTAATASAPCATKLPAKSFDIFTVEDGKLYFGKGNLTTAATRPQVIDRNRMFVRKENSRN